MERLGQDSLGQSWAAAGRTALRAAIPLSVSEMRARARVAVSSHESRTANRMNCSAIFKVNNPRFLFARSWASLWATRRALKTPLERTEDEAGDRENICGAWVCGCVCACAI